MGPYPEADRSSCARVETCHITLGFDVELHMVSSTETRSGVTSNLLPQFSLPDTWARYSSVWRRRRPNQKPPDRWATAVHVEVTWQLTPPHGSMLLMLWVVEC